MDGPVSVVGLLCRTSDRTPGGARGAQALAPRARRAARASSRASSARPASRAPAPWDGDLRDVARLPARGGRPGRRRARRAARFPVLRASDCSICMTTLPTVVRCHPEAYVLWLDAHGDFNTPDTTPSGFLGGMCLAAACGELGRRPRRERRRPARGSSCAACATSTTGERVLLEREPACANVAPEPARRRARRGSEVYVHLDLDVLDPSVLPAQFPRRRRAVGRRAAHAARRGRRERRTVVGVEITAFEAPEDEAERAPGSPSRSPPSSTPLLGVARMTAETRRRRCCARSSRTSTSGASGSSSAAAPEKIAKQHAAEQAHRARAHRPARRRGHVHRAGHARASRTSPSRRWQGRDAPADGVITGYGKVDGRLVAIAAYDFTVMAGSMGMTGEIKVARMRELALEQAHADGVAARLGRRAHPGGGRVAVRRLAATCSARRSSRRASSRRSPR